MSQAAVIGPGQGEIVGDAPDRRVEILSEDDALHVTWSRFGPGREGADLHVHRRHTDFFYVLDGELTIRLGPDGRPVRVGVGTLVRVPPLVVHGFRNGSMAEVRYLNLHAPGRGFAGYLRSLRDGRPITYDQELPPPDGGRSPAEAAIGGEAVLADRPDLRVALLADIEAVAVCEVRSHPGATAPPPHVHHRHVESLYVLEGALDVTAGGRRHRASAGSWVQIPAGVPHTFTLSGPSPASFLDIHAPGRGFGAFLRALHGAGDGRSSDAVAARTGFDQEPA